MHSIKYTVVIPTHNRAEYLPFSLKSVLDTSRDDVQVIVSNNHSTDETQELLENINDTRLNVISPDIKLPMAGHYEFALSHAKGEWITILGDDDAVMPYIFERLDKHIEDNPTVEIISSKRALYFWKGCEAIYGDSVLKYETSPITQIRSTTEDLTDVLRGVRSCFDMPQIYTTGIVKRSLYLEIKNKSEGCFYHSIIPDIYSVVALSLSRDKYLRVYEPLFWVGSSNKSFGISDRIYSDAKKFKNNITSSIPCVPNKISDEVSYQLHSSGYGALYIYECLLQSPIKHSILRDSIIREYVYSTLLYYTIITNRNNNISEIYKEINKYRIDTRIIIYNILHIIFVSLYDRFNKTIDKYQNILNRRRLMSRDRSKYPTIHHASKAVTNYINLKYH